MVGKENQGEKKEFSTLIRKDTQCNFIKLLRELFGKFFILPARRMEFPTVARVRDIDTQSNMGRFASV